MGKKEVGLSLICKNEPVRKISRELGQLLINLKYQKMPFIILNNQTWDEKIIKFNILTYSNNNT